MAKILIADDERSIRRTLKEILEFEKFVVDGVAGGVIKSTLAREFLNFKIKIPTKKGKCTTIL